MVTFTSRFKSLTILHRGGGGGGGISHCGGNIQWLRRSPKSNVDPLELYIVVRLTTLLVNNSQNNEVRTKHSQTQAHSGTSIPPHAFILSHVSQLKQRNMI